MFLLFLVFTRLTCVLGGGLARPQTLPGRWRLAIEAVRAHGQIFAVAADQDLRTTKDPVTSAIEARVHFGVNLN